jgi:nitrate/TMAO reductase-like tetraheme cytochrome c subunit
MTRERGGRVLAFLGILALPSLAFAVGFNAHVERSKKREFCLSCHIMEPYGKSLAIDDEEYVPASHVQNNRVHRDEACFTCHTTYALYGDIKAKIGGLRHIASTTWARRRTRSSSTAPTTTASASTATRAPGRSSRMTRTRRPTPP